MFRSRSFPRLVYVFVLLSAALATASVASPAGAEDALPPGTVAQDTGKPFATFVEDLTAAIPRHEMGTVADACATCGAAKIGVTIPGNRILMIFHPRYAVRMLEASVAAGIEAPLRLYVTENGDGTAKLTYRKPTAVFAPYGSEEIDALAAELDLVVEQIARDAIGG